LGSGRASSQGLDGAQGQRWLRHFAAQLSSAHLSSAQLSSDAALTALTALALSATAQRTTPKPDAVFTTHDWCGWSCAGRGVEPARPTVTPCWSSGGGTKHMDRQHQSCAKTTPVVCCLSTRLCMCAVTAPAHLHVLHAQHGRLRRARAVELHDVAVVADFPQNRDLPPHLVDLQRVIDLQQARSLISKTSAEPLSSSQLLPPAGNK